MSDVKPLRVYAERAHYTEKHRKLLNDILKAHWNPSTHEQRVATYGSRATAFEVVERPDEAELHLLTMKWQHYVDEGCVPQALRAVETARRARRPIAVFSFSDYTANFPVEGADIHLFQPSGYRSRRRTNEHGIPAFIEDPRAGFAGGSVEVRDRAARATVGFCGQAGTTLLRHAARAARNRLNQLQWRLGRLAWEPAPLEHTWFRQRVLDTFSRSHELDARFILRTKYRAGVQADSRNDPADRARREFLENINGTDYTLCVRGGGNFSIRFYEALAFGRIPVFIDTDCILPYHDSVDWKRFVVWVDQDRLEDGPRSVARYHASLSAEAFRERQLECRKLWEDRLSANGFYARFHEHFPGIERRG